jgi:hypothetical protein
MLPDAAAKHPRIHTTVILYRPIGYFNNFNKKEKNILAWRG